MSGRRASSRVLAGIVLAIACARPARAAGDAAGTTAGSFLTVGTGASVLSMSGATLATGNDLAAAAWNPASLARVDVLQFTLSHAPLPGGATQDWLSAGGRLGAGETRWSLQALFQQEGDLAGRDAANNPTGALSVSDLGLGARLAYPFSSAVSAGVGGQWVHESLAGSTGSGFAFDAGLRANAGRVGFALAGRNLGGGMDYSGTRYDLPGVLAAGVSWGDEPLGVRLDADFDSPLHYYRDVRVGGEWRWHDRVALRAGYRLELGAPSLEALSGATFGLGAGVGGTWLDYAYAPDGATGMGQHRIGLTFRPGLPARASMEARSAVRTSPRDPARQTAPAASRAPVTGTPAMRSPAARPSAPVPAATTPAATHVPSASDAGAASPPQRPAYVVVADGETLAMIARRWNTTVAALMEANDMVSAGVDPGRRLRLPPATPKR